MHTRVQSSRACVLIDHNRSDGVQRRGLRSGPMRDNRYQPQLNELLGCSPHVVVALGQLQPKWQLL